MTASSGSERRTGVFELMSYATMLAVGSVAACALGDMSLEDTTLIGASPYAAVGAALFGYRIPKRVVVTEPDVQGWRVYLGQTAFGQKVYHDFAAIPHMKAGGATGSGKTKGLELLLAQLVMKKEPSQLEVHIIDMKGGASFAHFARLPHVAGRIYADAENAAQALENIVIIQNKRLERIRRAREQFLPIPSFPRILVVIDEGGELSPAYAYDKQDEKIRRQCLAYLSTLARVGREPCISLVYSTQRPSNETLPVGIRGQMDATMAFRTQNELDSGILLRNEKAARLPNIKGRMIYQTPDGEKVVQTGMIPELLLRRWMEDRMDMNRSDKKETSCADNVDTFSQDKEGGTEADEMETSRVGLPSSSSRVFHDFVKGG
ncbi:FtsK/SpoIIIE domain-containing protein [Alicyclobacillus tolerans]|uniref:FtsK domain-containing protein n=1 Tax=Alicyclobacillus tolerans TaxID=90970 RepID=A0ABT9LZX3_9BACL|nr:FtsK/SpoIIIE domain-containing protein [Alicyclobacillus tengchongensis]MDP9729813.1 hypothetical protein [Alicyclobacillus tengchongensis]